MGALGVTGQPKYRDGLRAAGRAGRASCPFGDVAAARAAITDQHRAVIVEPIQAEGGIILPPPGYLQELRRLCTDDGRRADLRRGPDRASGRTGTFYAFESEGVVPDVVTLAKGLAGGVPIGAMLANEEVARGFEPGTHASTFGGNPLATAAALYVQQAIDELRAARALPRGGRAPRLGAAAAGRAAPAAHARRARAGPAAGAHPRRRRRPTSSRARASAGLLLSVAGGNVVRFAPPLIVSKAEIDEAVADPRRRAGGVG